MFSKTINGVVIECCQGNIANQPDITAIVNAANAQLRSGGGVAGAIHHVAGPGLERECRVFAPIKPGQAVISSGQKLPNKYVIHCLGPVYGVDKPANKLLASCYRKTLVICEQQKIDSVAFPAISAGAFGYPLKESALVVFKTMAKLIPSLKYVKKIRFVLYTKATLYLYQQILEKEL